MSSRQVAEIARIVFFCLLIPASSAIAQTSQDADAIVPQANQIQSYTIRTPLGGRETLQVTVDVGTRNETELILMPIWRADQLEWQDGEKWVPIVVEHSPEVRLGRTGELALQVRLRNLNSDPDVQKAIARSVCEQYANDRNLPAAKLKISYANVDPESLILDVTANVPRPNRDESPVRALTKPQRLPNTAMLVSTSVQMELDPTAIKDLADRKKMPLLWSDLHLRVRADFRSKLLHEEASASLSIAKDSVWDLRNRVASATSPQPGGNSDYLLSMTGPGSAEQKKTLMLLSKLDVQATFYSRSTNSPARSNQRLSELLAHKLLDAFMENLREKELANDKRLTVLLAENVAISGTVNEIREFSKKTENEQKEALEKAHSKLSKDERSLSLGGGVAIAGIVPVPIAGVPLPVPAKGEASGSIARKTLRESLEGESLKEITGNLNRCGEFFAGKLGGVSGIKFDQRMLETAARTLSGEFNENTFQIGWSNHSWNAIPIAGTVPSSLLSDLQDQSARIKARYDEMDAELKSWRKDQNYAALQATIADLRSREMSLRQELGALRKELDQQRKDADGRAKAGDARANGLAEKLEHASMALKEHGERLSAMDVSLVGAAPHATVQGTKGLTGVSFSTDGTKLFASGEGSATSVFAFPQLTASTTLYVRIRPFTAVGTPVLRVGPVPGSGLVALLLEKRLDFQQPDGTYDKKIDIPEMATDFAFKNDGEYVAIGGDSGKIRFWGTKDLDKYEKVYEVDGGVRRLIIAPDDTTLVATCKDGSVFRWNLKTDVRTRVAEATGNSIDAAAVSRDGNLLATGDSNGRITLRDLTANKQIGDWHSSGESIFGLAFSPNGKVLASAGSSKTVKLWRIVNPVDPVTLTGHTDVVQDLAFAPDGTMLASGSRDGVIRLWRAGPSLQR